MVGCSYVSGALGARGERETVIQFNIFLFYFSRDEAGRNKALMCKKTYFALQKVSRGDPNANPIRHSRATTFQESNPSPVLYELRYW